MDETLKQEFDSFCKDMGLTMTIAFTVFAKTVVRRQKIPFDIGKELPHAAMMAAIEEVRAMKKDPSLGKTYTDVDEMMKELLS